jgi:hypothetical protein
VGVLLISPDRMCENFKDLKALGASEKTTGFLYGIRARSCLRLSAAAACKLSSSNKIEEKELQRRSL